MSIPVLDFGAYSLDEEAVTDEQMDILSKELEAALTQVGMVFLKNTGISQEEVGRVMDISRKFFLQPDEMKKAFTRTSLGITSNHGWLRLEEERLNPNRPADLKESFDIDSFHPDIKWPSGELEGFKEIQTSFFQRCKELTLRVLRVMAHSLHLDPDVFLNAHQFIGTDENGTTLRSLYYPPIKHERVKEDQVRCGEHTDFGSFTLLFNSSTGLQVRRRSGEFVSAPIIPGAILLNMSDLTQRWTNDHYAAVVHRVMLPPPGDTSTRYSLAFFVHPDKEVLITCLDGSNKYPPVKAIDYVTGRDMARLDETGSQLSPH